MKNIAVAHVGRTEPELEPSASDFRGGHRGVEGDTFDQKVKVQVQVQTNVRD